MKNFFLTILLTWLTYTDLASGPGIYDKLIISKDTFLIKESPLYQLFQKKNIYQNALWSGISDYVPGWGKSFIGIWEIKSDSLFLNKILLISSEGTICTKNIIHHCFLSEKIKNEQIFADWYAGDLISPKGKELFYCSNSEEYIYESDMIYEIKNGLLTKYDLYDNSKSKNSEYFDNPTLLNNFIYSNIHWERIKSEIDINTKKVICQIVSCDEYGRIDSVLFIRGGSPALNEEAFMAIKSIPHVQITYKKGIPKYWPFLIQVDFSIENYKKYGNAN
jgi:hypothetical protein